MSLFDEIAAKHYADLPAGWRLQKLKFVSDIQTSNVDKVSSEDEEPVRLCNYLDVYNNDSITPDMRFMEATASDREIEKFTLKDGQVLITKDSESWDDIGISALVRANMPGVLCGYHLAIFTPNSDELDSGFLAWLCRADALNDQFKLSANGVTRFGLGQYAMNNAVIAVPPLATQIRIAAFLDEKTAQIDALIAKKQALMERLAEKRQAIITRAVTKGLNPAASMKDSGVEWLGQVPAQWDVCALGQKIKLQRGVDITKDERVAGDIPVVSSGGVDYFHDKALCKGPGVLVGRKGSAGKLHYIETDYWPHDTTLYVREFRDNVPRYVWYVLSTLELTSFDTGSSNPTVNRNRVHPMRTVWPNSNDQERIVAHLDYGLAQLDEIGEQIATSSKVLEEYRASVIRATITGQLENQFNSRRVEASSTTLYAT